MFFECLVFFYSLSARVFVSCAYLCLFLCVRKDGNIDFFPCSQSLSKKIMKGKSISKDSLEFPRHRFQPFFVFLYICFISDEKSQKTVLSPSHIPISCFLQISQSQYNALQEAITILPLLLTGFVLPTFLDTNHFISTYLTFLLYVYCRCEVHLS